MELARPTAELFLGDLSARTDPDLR
jgi:hypothetical protein